MNKLSVFALILMLFSEVLSQQNTAFNFLLVDPSARSSALAGAFEMYSEDPNIIFYNPAGLSTSDKKMVSAGFGKYLLDMNFGTAAYQMKYKNIGWFGLGIKYFNYGSFDYANENELTGGTFSASDLLITLGYSNYVYDLVNWGINFKYIQSNIAEYNSSAVACDIGFLYSIPSQNLNVALSLNNLGGQINPYIKTKEKLPLDLRIGFSKKLEHLPLRISFSLSRLNEERDKLIQKFKSFAIGGEFLFSDNFMARIGYSNEKRQDMKLGTTLGLAGFSGGIGIKIQNRYSFDFAFNSFGKIGSSYRFNLGYSFE
jgi:hypothetical protein